MPAPQHKSAPPTLRAALDFAPLALFFIVFKWQGLLPATAALVATTLICLAIIYALEKKLAMMPLVTGIMVTLLGGITLYLHDEQFIKMKPTAVNLLFASVLLGGVAFKKPMLKYVMSYAFQLTDRGWILLSLRWGLFFIGLAALNEYIWRNYSTDFWVNFKVFGMLTCTLVFTIAQLPLIKRHMIEETPNK
jgi:intracellular septation protein